MTAFVALMSAIGLRANSASTFSVAFACHVGLQPMQYAREQRGGLMHLVTGVGAMLVTDAGTPHGGMPLR